MNDFPPEIPYQIMPREDDWPLVSIAILTYNQREYIGRAIEGVLMQQVQFTFEIIVGDDCSSDGTQDVLRDYQQRYPDLIRLTLHPKRYVDEVPGRTNNMTNLAACRGKYTAMLDGDDYWTDPLKLQRQVDVLEQGGHLLGAFHDSRYEFAPNIERPDLKSAATVNGKVGNPPAGEYHLADVLPPRRVLIKPSTLLFRTRAFKYFPDWFERIVYADVFFSLSLFKLGPLYYDPAPMAVQFINSQSFVNSFGNQPALLRRRIYDVEMLDKLFGDTMDTKILRNERAQIYWKLIRRASIDREHFSMLRHTGMLLFKCPHFIARRLVLKASKLLGVKELLTTTNRQ